MTAKAYHIPNIHTSVRAGFVAQGTSLAAWCLANGVHRYWALQVLKGEAKGEAAQLLRARLVRESGMNINREQSHVAINPLNAIVPALCADNGGEAKARGA
jgi:hypothetical protein